MTVLVVKYFTYLKHTAMDRLGVRLNVILFFNTITGTFFVYFSIVLAVVCLHTKSEVSSFSLSGDMSCYLGQVSFDVILHFIINKPYDNSHTKFEVSNYRRSTDIEGILKLKGR